MAEVLAAVSILANFISLVEFGGKVLSRLQDYRHSSRRLPSAFQGIAVDLPLVLDTLRRTHDKAKTGAVSDITLQKLEPIVERCQTLVVDLDRLLDSILPKEKDSVWRRGKKLVTSIKQEKAFDEIASGIQKVVWT